MTTSAIFNSFHVTFVEHLDQQPVDLLPRTTIALNPDVPASWDNTSNPQSPNPAQQSPPSLYNTAPMIDSTIPFSTKQRQTSPNMPPPPIIPSIQNEPSLSYNTPIPLCHSSWTHTSPSQFDLNDGLIPGHHLVDTISNSSSSTDCLCHLRAAKQTSPLDDRALALLSKFSPFVDSHCLDLCDVTPVPLNSVLSAITDGSLKPHAETDDDPLWAKAMASPEHEF